MDHINEADGAWTMGFIAMVGGSIAAIVKLIQSNGCRMTISHCNGNKCCDVDCDEGRQPPQKSDTTTDSAV